ncbi:hypothetical protein PAA26_01750 [Methanomassiliicoccaceae archaeon COG_1]|nr:hypothetical protein [Methanomassiliicoccaceae archaeon COG_1]
MNAEKFLAVFAAAAFTLAALAVVCDSDDSDAIVGMGSDVSVHGFKEGRVGTIEIAVTNNDASDVNITLIAAENGKQVGDAQEFTIPAETYTADGYTVDFKLKLSPGRHDIIVTGTPSDVFATGTNAISVRVVVDESLWSSTTTYLVIVVLAIIVVAGVYMYIRSKPKDTTKKVSFTELEEQKRAGEPAKTGGKPPSTARRKYSAGSAPERRTDDSKMPGATEEKSEGKKVSFTELEEQKKTEKSAKTREAKTEEKPSEPKKIKYKSSRRQ